MSRKHKIWLALGVLTVCAAFAVLTQFYLPPETAFVLAGSKLLFIADAGIFTAEDAKELKDLIPKMKKASDDVAKFGETHDAELKNLGKVSQETKDSVDKALTAFNGLDEKFKELEQKMVRALDASIKSNEVPKTPGQIFTEDKGFLDWLQTRRSGKFSVGMKAILTSLTTNADGSAGDLIVPQRLAIVPPLLQELTVRDLISPGQTNANAIQYPVETGYTNAAASVSETSGAAKPESTLKFDLTTKSVTTIAHWLKAHRNILDDVPFLRSYIDARMIYGLKYVEDAQLLMGSGSGSDLSGIYTQATVLNPTLIAVTGSMTAIDIIRIAMLQAQRALLPATGIVLNPIDWARMEILKDTTGRYILSNPQGTTDRRLWGLPVVATWAMTEDKYLTGAFKAGAQVFDRQEARVEIATENSDDFVKNLVTILCEERLALAVYRPEAFVKGDLGQVAANTGT